MDRNGKAEFPIDLHTHTLASYHAYSTITENARAAADRGLTLLATTEHTPAMADAPHEMHFLVYDRLPKELFGVRMLYGAELNILDFKGKVDLPKNILERQDICLASLHANCMKPGSREENTGAYLAVMENPYVRIIGHPNYLNIPVDYKLLAKRAAEYHIALELNNSTLRKKKYTEGCTVLARELLACCAEYGTDVSLGSDAHFWTEIGDFPESVKLLDEIGFPREQIINTSLERFDKFMENSR